MLLLTTLPVLAKAVLVALLARAFGATPGAALRTGLYLAQAGEFGFVLLTLASRTTRLVAPQWLQPGAGQHGAVDAGHAVHRDVQQPHRDAAVGERLDDAVGAADDDRQASDRAPRPT